MLVNDNLASSKMTHTHTHIVEWINQLMSN